MAEPYPSTARDLIIVAEDSPPNRKILGHLIEKMGFTVRSFENGDLAWKALNGECRNAVAIVSDIMMPCMDGIEFLRLVRESQAFAELPFVLITAISENEYMDQATALNVNSYIQKPVTFQRVSAKLQELFPNKTFPRLAG